MVKSSRRPNSARKGTLSSRKTKAKDIFSEDAIKATEQVALAAFGSGLRIAAAFGTVAAKTASLALSSLATGADKFSELVRKEATAKSSLDHTSRRKSKLAAAETGSRRRRRQL